MVVSIVISNRAMTLTDTYWIKEYNEDIKWTEVCLHRRKSMDNNEINQEEPPTRMNTSPSTVEGWDEIQFQSVDLKI